MNTFKCPICSAGSFTKKAEYKASSQIFANRHIVRCNQCHTLMVHPLPVKHQLDHYYNAYWKQETIEEMLPLFEAQAAARFEFLRPFMPEEEALRVLDIGAGFGLIHGIMQKAAGRDITYDAVEIDPLAVHYLRTHIMPRVIFDRLEDVRDSYQIILLSHFIEHVANPVHFLDNLTRHIHSKGILFIEVPNQDHKFKSLNEPHLFFFDRQTLSHLVVQSGFDVLHVDICGPQIDELQERRGIALVLKHVLRGRLPHNLKAALLAVRKRLSGKSTLAGIPRKALYDYNPWGRWIRLVALKKESKP